ncbi:perforin-1-like [Emys orbicularis]|uniref:perforin-1-like n=1 Tax=Emys orbicularis TaxID=82168 RepID=UPI0031FCCD43
MVRSGAFIPLLLLFLLPGVSPDCYTGTAEECGETTTFVPAHSLVGEGIDVTTLKRTGANLVDTSLWRHPNGTCTLCKNRLQRAQLHRVPLAMVDWKVQMSCTQDLSSSVKESAAAVGRALAWDVDNDWMSELELQEEPHGPALRGSQSQLTSYAYQKEKDDKYMFVYQDMPCVFYRVRFTHDPPLMPQFTRALRSLPPRYESATYRPFLATYGTHYIRQADLGGRVRQLMAIETCRAVLDRQTATEIKDRLRSQFLQDLGLRQSSEGRGSSQEPYVEKRIQVTGGNSDSNLLFSAKQNANSFSTWMESLKASPDLVSYSVMPIHTLVRAGDPRREALKQAVKKYVAERGHRKSCPRSCPQGGQADSLDPCKCYCSGNPFTNSMCCSLERGMARLKVHVLKGADLWGDYLTATDAYVKVFFQGRELQTDYIVDNNNPVWYKDLNFGPVTLPTMLRELSKLELEVWDSNPWEDECLGRCDTNLEVGRSDTFICLLDHGHLEYSYTLECGPNLGGNNCHEYVPVSG